MELFKKMLKVRESVPYLKKSNKTQHSGRYSYITHDEVAEVVGAAMAKEGLFCLPTVVDHNQDGNMLTVKVRLTVHDSEEPADFISAEFLGSSVVRDDKAPGIATSYAVKTALLKLFMIPTGEADPEEHNLKHEASVEETVEIFGGKVVATTEPEKEELKVAPAKDRVKAGTCGTFSAIVGVLKVPAPAVKKRIEGAGYKNLKSCPQELVDEWVAAMQVEHKSRLMKEYVEITEGFSEDDFKQVKKDSHISKLTEDSEVHDWIMTIDATHRYIKKMDGEG